MGDFSWPTILFLAFENPGTLRLAKVEKRADGPPKLTQNPLVEPTRILHLLQTTALSLDQPKV